VRCGRPFAAVATGGKEHLESPGGFIGGVTHPCGWVPGAGYPPQVGRQAYLARTPQRRTHRTMGTRRANAADGPFSAACYAQRSNRWPADRSSRVTSVGSSGAIGSPERSCAAALSGGAADPEPDFPVSVGSLASPSGWRREANGAAQEYLVFGRRTAGDRHPRRLKLPRRGARPSVAPRPRRTTRCHDAENLIAEEIKHRPPRITEGSPYLSGLSADDVKD